MLAKTRTRDLARFPGVRRPGTSVSERYGFRRVTQVRVVVESQGVRATATGVTHRYPQTVPVPLHVAARLAAAGVPLEVERLPARPTGAA